MQEDGLMVVSTPYVLEYCEYTEPEPTRDDGVNASVIKGNKAVDFHFI